MRSKTQRRRPLHHLGYAQLLELRFCDLGLRIENTWLQECVGQLHAELEARDIRLKPHCWLSDEWFSPKRVPGIAIPFYLAHPKLIALERREVLDVEGGTWRECMRLLRHEAAHAVQTAYELHRKRLWQRSFGRTSEPYPDFYRPNPASRDFVQHLDGWYAQSHPDEDFAETFAVWLAPRSSWRRRYAKWPALGKLKVVDSLMSDLAGTAPKLRSRAKPHRLVLLRSTLHSHYEHKRERYAVTHPAPVDADLKRLFHGPEGGGRGETAHAFLRRHRKEIRELVARWTGDHQFAVEQVLKQIMSRCRQLGLRAIGSKRRMVTECAILLAVHTVQTIRSRQWHTL